MATLRSQRRFKILGLVVFLAVLTILYITSAARQTRESDFYLKTQYALSQREKNNNAQPHVQPKMATSDDDVSKRLKAAEDKAKKSANFKGDRIQEVVAAGKADQEKDRVIGKAEANSVKVAKSDASSEQDEITGERSVAGRVIMKDGKSDSVDGVARVGNVGDSVRAASANGAKSSSDASSSVDQTDEDKEAEEELNAILKKSPIIIFSKSYCGFSAKAKRILLEEYSIKPAPYVVELDKHPLGSAIQTALAKSTGRRTVPNVLINGRSIGGGDDVEALHLKGKLEETVRSMGGKRIVEAKATADKPTEKEGLRRVRVKRNM
ncbi:thioredoxin-like protein [Phyllosticta paracitricarpa]|uniref:Thioredoxin-like protein n=1 Tax=Phyllosticta citricarpa TaxID=55181 RepID=A0ABR1LSS4_9PEZI